MKKDKALSFTYLLHVIMALIAIKYLLGGDVIAEARLINPRSAFFLASGLVGGIALVLITTLAFFKRIELQLLLICMVATLGLQIIWLGYIYLTASIIFASYWFFVMRKGSIL